MKSCTLDSAMLDFTGVLVIKEAKASTLSSEVYKLNVV